MARSPGDDVTGPPVGSEEPAAAQDGVPTTPVRSEPPATLDGEAATSQAPAAPARAVPRTRVATLWTSLVFALVFLIVILIFIFQNLQDVHLSFFTLHGRFPLALALVFSAILGALIVLCLGGVRILQLRRLARRNLAAPPPD